MTSKFRWKIVMICSISGIGGIVVGYCDTPVWLTFVIGGVCTLIAMWIMESETQT